jgi:hypothetical protein
MGNVGLYSSWRDFLLAEKLSLDLAAGHTHFTGLRQLELGAHWVMTASSFSSCVHCCMVTLMPESNRQRVRARDGLSWCPETMKNAVFRFFSIGIQILQFTSMRIRRRIQALPSQYKFKKI